MYQRISVFSKSRSTTIAFHLAAAATLPHLRLKPLVVCQSAGTALMYNKYKNMPFDISSTPPAGNNDYDLIIHDQINPASLPFSPVVIMAVSARKRLSATHKQILLRAKRNGKRVITVVTDANRAIKEERENIMEIQLQGAFVLPVNGSFDMADAEYRTIFDKSLNNTYGINERRVEMRCILDAVLMAAVKDKVAM